MTINTFLPFGSLTNYFQLLKVVCICQIFADICSLATRYIIVREQMLHGALICGPMHYLTAVLLSTHRYYSSRNGPILLYLWSDTVPSFMVILLRTVQCTFCMLVPFNVSNWRYRN